MVLVQGGTFMMGEEKSFWDFGKDNVAHKVSLSSFWDKQIFVTQQLESSYGYFGYARNPSYFKGEICRREGKLERCTSIFTKLNQ